MKKILLGIMIATSPLTAVAGPLVSDQGQGHTHSAWCMHGMVSQDEINAIKERYGKTLAGSSSSIERSSSVETSSTAFASGRAQVVFLDFDSGVDGAIDYSSSQRDQIQGIMEGHYAGLDVTFTQAPPSSGEFTTIIFNAGSPGGLAVDGIDVGNDNKSELGIVNVDGLVGILADNGNDNVVTASAFIGSHELGHLLGMRHLDSVGPIGSGEAPTGAGPTLPTYPGPSGAVEFSANLMSSPASVGSDIQRLSFADNSFSERTLIQLSMNEQVALGTEGPDAADTVGSATLMPLTELSVFNSLSDFKVNAQNTINAAGSFLEGSLGFAGDIDVYEFFGEAGDILNIKLTSIVNNSIDDLIDGFLRVLDEFGNPLDYFGTPAVNDDELESFDAWILDLILPSSGSFFIEVSASPFAIGSSVVTGDYVLTTFLTSIEEIPLPAPIAFIGLGLLGLGMVRRRRMA